MAKSLGMPPTQAMKKKASSLPRDIPADVADTHTQPPHGEPRRKAHTDPNKKKKRKQSRKKVHEIHACI